MLPLGGCLLTGEPPEPGLDIPLSYDGGPKNPAVAEAAVPPLDWWRGFHSSELTEIIEDAREANLDIAAAIARIVQADAQARVTGATLLPSRRPQRQRYTCTIRRNPPRSAARAARSAAPNATCSPPR